MSNVITPNTTRGFPRCQILGVLDDGNASLSVQALAHLAKADVLIGAGRTLALLQSACPAHVQVRDLTGALSKVPEWIRQALEQGQHVVVLATGDPLCYGIAAYLASHLCVEALEIVPNVSTIQLACARLSLPWQDMRLASVHSADAGEWSVGATPEHKLYALLQDIRQYDRLAVLTSPQNTPDRVARMLLAEGLQNDWQLAVAERLCQAEERVWSDLTVEQAAQMQFAQPNVLLMWRHSARQHPVVFGLPDASYEQRQPDKGLITKQEVRAVSLARLQLRANSVVWDIGAGSGSVGLEAARLCPRGHVYAIEKNSEDFAIAQRNHRAMGVSNYTLVNGKAPQGLDAWAAPDAVFIGGSGGELAELIKLILKRLRPGGWLVMNFVTLENLATATATLAEMSTQWDVVQLQAARSKPILHMHRMAAENPVWVVCAQAADANAQTSTSAADTAGAAA